MALGAGSLPEELFGICHRGDCSVVKMLRKRALRDLLTLGESVTEVDILTATSLALKEFIDYAKKLGGTIEMWPP